MSKIYGFIFADEMEYKPFCEHALAHGGKELDSKGHNIVSMSVGSSQVVAIESGVGKVNAAVAAVKLIEEYKVDAVLNAGLSGAVSHLNKGDVAAGTSYVECDFDIRAFGRRLGEKTDGTRFYKPGAELLAAALKVNGIKEAALGTGDFFLQDTDIKNAYKEEFKINAFDMESAAIAAACDKYGVPFLSIRKISDDADDSAVDSYTELNDLAETALTEVLLEVVSNL